MLSYSGKFAKDTEILTGGKHEAVIKRLLAIYFPRNNLCVQLGGDGKPSQPVETAPVGFDSRHLHYPPSREDALTR